MLSPFEPAEREILDKVLDAAADAVILLLRRGIRQAMNEYNPLDFSAGTDDTEKTNR